MIILGKLQEAKRQLDRAKASFGAPFMKGETSKNKEPSYKLMVNFSFDYEDASMRPINEAETVEELKEYANSKVKAVDPEASISWFIPEERLKGTSPKDQNYGGYVAVEEGAIVGKPSSVAVMNHTRYVIVGLPYPDEEWA